MRAIFSEALAVYGDKLICADYNYNIIYFADVHTGKVLDMISIPEEGLLTSRLVGAIHIYNQRILFAPFNSQKIWIFDLEANKWIDIGLMNSTCQGKFWNLYAREEFVFLIPTRYPYFVRINMNTFDVVELTDINIIENDFLYGNFMSDYVSEEGVLYLASCNSNRMMIFSTDTMEYTWKRIGNDKNMFSGVIKVGDSYWFSPRRNTPLVCYNITDDSCIEYNLPSNYTDGYHFLGITENNGILLPGVYDNESLIFNPESCEFISANETRAYAYVGWINKETYLQSFRNGDITIAKKENVNSIRLIVDDQKDKSYFESFARSYRKDLCKKVIFETACFDVQLFMNLI